MAYAAVICQWGNQFNWSTVPFATLPFFFDEKCVYCGENLFSALELCGLCTFLAQETTSAI